MTSLGCLCVDWSGRLARLRHLVFRRLLLLSVPGVLALACGADPPQVTGCEPGDGLLPICGFSNPEDLALMPGGAWVLVSQLPAADASQGNLIGFRVSDRHRRVLYPGAEESLGDGAGDLWGSAECPGPPDADTFAPHGVDMIRRWGSHQAVAVVNHGREAVELFDLGYASGGPALGWRGCVPLPEGAWANDVALLADGRLLVTNMMPPAEGPGALVTIAKLVVGLNTGSVLEWAVGTGWTQVAGSEGSGPNGVAATPHGDAIYFTEWGGQRLVRIQRGGDDPVRSVVDLPHHGDNITWTRDGHLLVTGQDGGLMAILACGSLTSGTCAIPFSVFSVDPVSFEPVAVLTHDGSVTGAGSVALEIGDRLYLGTFAGDRIAVLDRGR